MKKTLAFAALIAHPAWAQDTIDLGTLTLTASTSDTELARSGSTVEVVEKDDLEKSGDILLADYLNTLPGISYSANGGLGTSTTLRVRGAGPQYLGVYVDGIDVNDPSGTQIAFDFGTLMTGDISRIEVLKGAQSALYGSEAIAGVINITTNRATEPGTLHSLNAEYGSFNTLRMSYNFSHRGDRGGAAITLGHVKTDGISAADENDGNTERDGHESRRVSFSTDYALTEQVEIGLSGFWQESESAYDEYDPGTNTISDGTPDETSDVESRALRGYVKIDGDVFGHEAALSHYEIDRASHGTNAFGSFRYPYSGKRQALTYRGTAMIHERFSLGFGADYTRESYRTDGASGSHKIKGLFVEADWSPTDRIDLIGTVRRDDHSVFGDKITGRVAAAYRPVDDLVLRFSAGSGFRAPSLYELYDPFAGNASLKPESSENIEFGVEKGFAGGGLIRAALFRTRIDDLIDYDLVTSTYTQVPGKTRMQGVELSFAAPLTDRITLSGNATYTDTEDKDGKPIARVPETDLTLRLDADVTDRLRAGISVQHVRDITGNDGMKLPDYTRVNLTTGYKVNDNVEIYARIENALDEEYQTSRGYGTPDRAFYAGLRASF